jgi:hypothetical protein
VLENVAVAPLVSVLAFVCSVGNVPLAAALWGHGVAFGGVIAFLFADLVTLPLLVIYRRYYGTADRVAALRVVVDDGERRRSRHRRALWRDAPHPELSPRHGSLRVSFPSAPRWS